MAAVVMEVVLVSIILFFWLVLDAQLLPDAVKLHVESETYLEIFNQVPDILSHYCINSEKFDEMLQALSEFKDAYLGCAPQKLSHREV